MIKDNQDSGATATQESSAGAPANLSVERPTDYELDQRDREKAGPRRAAGPSFSDAGSGSRDEAAQEPPPSTDPRSESQETGLPVEEPIEQRVTSASAEAGLPVDHVGPKPSADELDRRDRQKTGLRRAAGPPLADGGPDQGTREATIEQLPPETDPDSNE